MNRIFIFLFTISNTFFVLANAQNETVVQYKEGLIQIAKLEAFIDKSKKLTIDDVKNKEFTPHKASFSITNNAIWAKIRIENLSDSDSMFLEIKNPVLFDLSFYTVNKDSVFNNLVLGRKYKFSEREFQEVTGFVYPVYVPRGSISSVFIRIDSYTPIHLPVYLGKKDLIIKNNLGGVLEIGVYIGVVLIMFFYNLFISFTVKDKSYYYYVLYIIFVGLAQLVINGFANKYFWPDNVWLSTNSYNLFGILSGIFTGTLAKSFLQTHFYSKRINNAINFMIGLYLLCIFIHFFVSPYYAFIFINFLAGTGALLIIYAAIFIVRRNYRPARYFLIAFSVFLVAVILFVFRSADMLPYNIYTSNILEIGSAIQITLLSFALADKINIYRKEQAVARIEALKIAKENERLIQNQNIFLEREVKNRTVALEQSNDELKKTLTKLKDTQIKLIDSEKMASLGQLTAGIAHEINNPINFVSANIKPLELDFNDLTEIIRRYEQIDWSKDVTKQIEEIENYKKQIDLAYINEEIRNLLNGIRDGANRTADIVSNLKNFARIDQSLLKTVNLNQGIESTLVLIRNTFPKDLIINKELGEIPLVECAPGKINQVFMNLINNGVQAVKSKYYSKTEQKALTIRTWQENEVVKISIKDNGIGMTDEVKSKIFEPFFTTKDVGEGTGLGMSIVKSIIDAHEGYISIQSAQGTGTEFIVTLPITSNPQK
ncbi:MAG TPA: 7TM diverse intracellular signaling domain-containing protein [Niabella sp.]|jgi:signal transduction histidine kinase|nr:7TM diverse intracellular signaling domain-containing protein [Niabella sp.]HUN01994.1 7TM diverse intracellular signaling domain-containing protein [Niabella sp.]